MNSALPAQGLAILVCVIGWACASGEEAAKRPAAWASPVELEGVPNLHRVSAGLYRSAQPTAAGMRKLQQLGIKTVVNLRSFHSDREKLKGSGLGYERLYLKTWHPEWDDAREFLKIATDPQRQPVLVHCQHGADRAGAMCAIYRIVVQGWTKDEAVREMREGGFGFHEVWRNLPAWIEKLKVERLRMGRDNR